jgi:Methyltransferase domain
MKSVSEIPLDYPIRPRVRFGWGRPSHPQMSAILNNRSDACAANIHALYRFADAFSRIEDRAADAKEPSWSNDWFPPLDAMALYGFVARRNPAIYLEIGSGNSTKFAARAVRDHGLRTRVISIDPSPRAEVDELCDEVIRVPLEDADPTVFARLSKGDILFCDNSHRSFQNSDVTVFFLEVLPSLPAGVLVGVHDIFLPHDYPDEWVGRFYNEQYLLACWLLAGGIEAEMPVHHCATSGAFSETLAGLFEKSGISARPHGGGFWFTRGASGG